jgi:phosphohistidine phosphatase SixA
MRTHNENTIRVPGRRAVQMRAISAVLALGCALMTTVTAQELSRAALVEALKRGGYVLVMRHTSSPREVPDTRTANPDNTAPERQLDETGRTTATAMGEALRRLAIPIGQVFTSPTYRARETVRFLSLKDAMPIEELGDAGRSMLAAGDAQAEWLQKIVARAPTANALVVTHMPNIARAFPKASDIADGETLIFEPDGTGGTALVARVKIEEWAAMRR